MWLGEHCDFSIEGGAILRITLEDRAEKEDVTKLASG